VDVADREVAGVDLQIVDGDVGARGGAEDDVGVGGLARVRRQGLRGIIAGLELDFLAGPGCVVGAIQRRTRRHARAAVRRERVQRADVLFFPDEDVAARTLRVGVGVEGVDEMARLLLHRHRAPLVPEGARVDPGLECHPVGEVERVAVRDRHPVVDAIEAEGAAEPASVRPRGSRHDAGVPRTGGVRDVGARRVVEGVGADQAVWVGRRRAGRDRRGHVRLELER